MCNKCKCTPCTERKPHPHANEIKAWADGAKIQVRAYPEQAWQDTDTPLWLECYNYRIKPEPKPDRSFGLPLGCLEGGGWVIGPTGWKNTIKVTVDGETGKLKSVEIIQ